MSEIKGMVKLMPVKADVIDGEEFLYRQWRGTKETTHWIVEAAMEGSLTKELFRVPVKHCDTEELLYAWDLAHSYALHFARQSGLFFDIEGSPRYAWDPRNKKEG